MLEVVVKGWIFVTFVVVEEGELCGRKNQNEVLSSYALWSWFDRLMKHLFKNKGSFFIFHF
jgi:hypothetical protein